MVISKVPPSDPGLGTLGTVTPGPLVTPPGGFSVKSRNYETVLWILYETGATVSATDLRLELIEVSMSDSVDNRCLQFAAAHVQVCGFLYLVD